MLLDHLHGCAETPWLERDDGWRRPALPADTFFAPPEAWPAAEHESVADVRGRVLDVGCGAGRHALFLQERSCDVVAIDVSPGAVEVARRRGVRDARLLAAHDVDRSLGAFDAFLLMCGNFGLAGSHAGGLALLERFAALANDGAVLVADCVDGPRVRLRLRYRDRVTPWFYWLNPSREELRAIAAEAGWTLDRVVDYDDEPAAYAAILRRDR